MLTQLTVSMDLSVLNQLTVSMDLSLFTQLSLSNELSLNQKPFGLFILNENLYFSFHNAFHFNSFNVSKIKPMFFVFIFTLLTAVNIYVH